MSTFQGCRWNPAGGLLALTPVCLFAGLPDDSDELALIALREAVAATRANAAQLVRFSVRVSYDGRPRYGQTQYRMAVGRNAYYFSQSTELWDGSKSKTEHVWNGREVWWADYVYPEGQVLKMGRRDETEHDFRPLGCNFHEYMGMQIPGHPSWGIWDLIEEGQISSLTTEASTIRATVHLQGLQYKLTLSPDGTGRVLQCRCLQPDGQVEEFFENQSFDTLEGIWYPTEVRWGIVDRRQRRGHAGRDLPPGEYAYTCRIEDLSLSPDFDAELKRMRALAGNPAIFFEDEMDRRNSRYPKAAMQRQQRQVNETPAWQMDKVQINQAPVAPGAPVSALPPRSKNWWYVSAALVGAAVCLAFAMILRRRQA